MWGSIISGVASAASSLFGSGGGGSGGGAVVQQVEAPDDISTVLDRIRRTHKNTSTKGGSKVKKKDNEMTDLMNYFMQMASK